MVIPFSDTGIIISPSNFILSPVTVLAVLLVTFMIGLFNFLQVCKFIIYRSEPESNWNLTDLFSTLTVMCLRMTLSDSSSLFACLTLFLIIFLFLQFWHFFFTIGTVLSPMYFSTTVASAGWFFWVVTRLHVLKFWVIIFFSLFYRRVWLGSMLDFPYINNTRLLAIFWVFSDTHYPLTVFSQLLKCKIGFVL